MRKDLIYTDEDNEIRKVRDEYYSERSHQTAKTSAPVNNYSSQPASQGIVYAVPLKEEELSSTEDNYFFHKFMIRQANMKKTKAIVIAALIANTLLTTNPGMELKKHIAASTKSCLEVVVGKNETKGFCHLSHHIFGFASDYVRKSLTWIDYRHK